MRSWIGTSRRWRPPPKSFNRRMRNWRPPTRGCRTEEGVNQTMLRLAIGLPVDQLAGPITESLNGKGTRYREVTVEATNRRGKSIGCRVVCTPLVGPRGGQPQGVVVLMEEEGVPSVLVVP